MIEILLLILFAISGATVALTLDLIAMTIKMRRQKARIALNRMQWQKAPNTPRPFLIKTCIKYGIHLFAHRSKGLTTRLADN